MKHVFILNPAAGQNDKTGQIRDKIKSAMSGRREEYEIHTTNGPMHAIELSMQAAQSGDEVRIYACGGDGTLNEAVCGAAGYKNASVTHIPAGSGNDFIKIFGADAYRFLDINELIDGETHEFDLIECGDRQAINICSVGFDARIGTEVHRYKNLPLISGKGAYNMSVLVNFIKGIHLPYEVEADGVRFDGRYTMLVVCNGRYYGGGYCPVPEAEPDDRLLDFLLVGPVSRFTVARLISSFSKGRWREYPEIFKHMRGRELRVRADRISPVNLDGERLNLREMCFRISEKKLVFAFPRGASWKNGQNTAD